MKQFFKLIGILSIGVLCLAATISLWSSSKTTPSLTETKNALRVTTSFYPLAEFAKQVGGSNVTVKNLTPAGAEPHDFDPTPQDMIAVQNSHLFVYNGAGFERWVAKVLPEVPEATIVVDTSNGISLMETDPHIWLDPVLAQTQVENIARGLIAADAPNRGTYQANTQKYLHELRTLDDEFRKSLATCQKRDIVTSHDAFQYLAKRYTLHVTSLAGLSPDEEPSPKKIAEVSNFVKEKHVEYIFFESLVSPKLAETIARETGAQTLVFNPLEGLTDQQLANGDNYLSVQRQNLQNLKTALHCQ